MGNFVTGPIIGPEAMANAGQTVTSPGGGKEIHFDSSVIRSQYDSGGLANPDFTPPIVEGSPATSDAAAASQSDLMSPELLKAVMGGQPPDPAMMAKLVAPVARPIPMGGQHIPTPAILSSSIVELRVPLGGGVMASVTFNGEPKPKHWRRLLSHIQIEADPDNEFEEETPSSTQAEESRPRGNQKGKGKHLRAGNDEGQG